jgi:CNH domain
VRLRLVSVRSLGGEGVLIDMGAGGARRIVYGTDDGVYLSDLRAGNQDPVKVLELLDVSQVDVLEEYQLLIVLSGEPGLRPSIDTLLICFVR